VETLRQHYQSVVRSTPVTGRYAVRASAPTTAVAPTPAAVARTAAATTTGRARTLTAAASPSVSGRVPTPPATVVAGSQSTAVAGRKEHDETTTAVRLTGKSDARAAASHGATLGTSLLFTSTLGVLVSLFFVPNMVGERGAGILGFGEAMATVALVVAGLGMDTYLRKELAVQRDHASGFLASVLAVRLLLSVVITSIAIGVMLLRHQDLRSGLDAASADSAFRTTIVVLLLYFIAQFFQQTGETFAAMLQAVGEVRQQSRLTIVSKTMGCGLHPSRSS
jgi:hypothetical protein